MSRIREKKNYWIGGSIIAFSGVALVKLLAPDLNGFWQQALQAVGYLLVIAGLTILACATRRTAGDEFIEPPERSNR